MKLTWLCCTGTGLSLFYRQCNCFMMSMANLLLLVPVYLVPSCYCWYIKSIQSSSACSTYDKGIPVYRLYIMYLVWSGVPLVQVPGRYGKLHTSLLRGKFLYVYCAQTLFSPNILRNSSHAFFCEEVRILLEKYAQL